LREVPVTLNGMETWVAGALDSGSELVVISRRKVEELGLEVNGERRLVMEAANGSRETMKGCVEWLEVGVGGLQTWAHAFVVENAPFDLLLGLPWQHSVQMRLEMKEGGKVDVVVHDP
ncbi:hypothetical protein DFP72DRAFT_785030, partial [Ephemerocybe angulata]